MIVLTLELKPSTLLCKEMEIIKERISLYLRFLGHVSDSKGFDGRWNCGLKVV